MRNDAIVKPNISVRLTVRPNTQRHEGRLSIRRRREQSITLITGILHHNVNRIIADSAFPEVVLLEVERRLREAVLVRNVVDLVDNEEDVSLDCIRVSVGFGDSLRVERVEELSGAGLFCCP